MDLAISIGIGGWILIIAAALIAAVAFQFPGQGSRSSFVIDAFAVAIGAVLASEIVVVWRTVEPVWDGLALVPAALGGLAVGAVVDLSTRYLTGGRTAGRPMAA